MPKPSPSQDSDPVAQRITWQWRKLRPHETDMELLWLVVIPVTGGLYLLLRSMQPVLFQCKFKALTGVPCATCGGTRSVLAMLQGFDVSAAFFSNPLVFVGLGFVSLFLLYSAVVVVFRRPRLRVRVPKRLRMRGGLVFLGLLLTNWAYLIIDGR